MDDRIANVFNQAVAEAYLMVQGEGLASIYRLLNAPSVTPEREEEPLPEARTA